MRKTMLAITLAAAAVIPAGPALAVTALPDTPTARTWNHETVQQRRYDRNRGEYYGGRHWDRNQRRYYRERRLSRNDRIWRGRDGRYYCRRSDGTTGLIVGAAIGGILGNAIAGRGDATLGTILGLAGGGLLGREIDRGNVRCR
jgi:hypothetical protein